MPPSAGMAQGGGLDREPGGGGVSRTCTFECSGLHMTGTRLWWPPDIPVGERFCGTNVYRAVRLCMTGYCTSPKTAALHVELPPCCHDARQGVLVEFGQRCLALPERLF